MSLFMNVLNDGSVGHLALASGLVFGIAGGMVALCAALRHYGDWFLASPMSTTGQLVKGLAGMFLTVAIGMVGIGVGMGYGLLVVAMPALAIQIAVMVAALVTVFVTSPRRQLR